jgi:GntR family transcriptional regulator
MIKYRIDHQSSVPLHAQVEQLIRKMAELKPYKEGKLLPNEVDLAKQLGISRNTLRQATSKLVYEGVLIRKKGVGTRFSDTHVDSRARNWSSFSQEMSAKGIQVKNFEIRATWVSPDREVARFLGIGGNRKVLQMERLRGTAKGPFVYFISWFHPRIGLTGSEDFSKPLYEILEKEYATVVRVSKEEISACLADRELALKLNMDQDQPVLKRKRLVFDPGHRPVEYNIGYYRGDSFTYTIESERDL